MVWEGDGGSRIKRDGVRQGWWMSRARQGNTVGVGRNRLWDKLQGQQGGKGEETATQEQAPVPGSEGCREWKGGAKVGALQSNGSVMRSS